MPISNLSNAGRCVSGTHPNKHVQYPFVPLIDFNRFWWYPSVTKSMTKHETRSTPRPDLGWFQKMLVSLWIFLVGRCMHLGWFPIPPSRLSHPFPTPPIYTTTQIQKQQSHTNLWFFGGQGDRCCFWPGTDVSLFRLIDVLDLLLTIMIRFEIFPLHEHGSQDSYFR